MVPSHVNRKSVRKIILLGILFTLGVSFFTYVKYHRYHQGLSVVVSSDALGYHQYLPAVFIYGDVFHQPYSYQLSDGRFFNKYNYGIALMQLPFYLLAHAAALIFDLPSEGKITPYIVAVILAGVVYTFLGLLVLFRLLLEKFNVQVTWITIIAVFLGTNLLFYSYREPGMSHVYAFFLVVCFIWSVHRLYDEPGFRTSLPLSVSLGLLTLVRSTNLMVIVYLLIYEIHNWKGFRKNLNFLTGYWPYLTLIPLMLLIFYLPQLLYWYSLTGQYFVNPYHYSVVEEGFLNWRTPRFGTVLFGPVGGWLVITPLMIFSLAGIGLQFNRKIESPLAVAIILILTLYLYASWWHPTLAGSYGHRGFVDIYPFLAFPLAEMFRQVLSSKNKLAKYGIGVLVILLVYINIRFSWQYEYWWWDVEWGWQGYINTLSRAFFVD